MTLSRNAAGVYECLFRKQGRKPLHLSLRTKKKSEATARHDAVHQAWRAASDAFLAQLRDGTIAVERVAAMVANNESLIPVAAPPVAVAADAEASGAAELPWPTVDETVARYLAWMAMHPNKREATTTLAGFQIKRFQAFVYDGVRVGTLALDRVPAAAIQAYQHAQLEGKVPVNTITTYMSRVGVLWRWAIAQEERAAREARRPIRTLYSPVDSDLLVREVHRRDRVLTAAEADRLLAATPTSLLFPVGAGLLAGLRIGEMLHLRPRLDVDVDVGSITIRDQPDWKPKTRRARRLVPMSEALRALAEHHLRHHANDAWMLPSPVDRSRPVTELGFRAWFIPIVERAALRYGRGHSQGVVYHTLRHTFASQAVMHGVDLYTVATLLGDSLKMVEETYAHLSPDFKRAAVAKLAGAFTLPNLSELIQPVIQETEVRGV